jgi:CRISPR-associated protein Csb2
LSPLFHGGGDEQVPEWPPSPLRLFQALVRTAAALYGKEEFGEKITPWLEWLERLEPPLIVAPPVIRGKPIPNWVPNNDQDLLMRAWARRSIPQKSAAELKTEKTIHPHHFHNGSTLHYLWDVSSSPPPEKYLTAFHTIASHLFALGWGIDLIVAHAQWLNAKDVDGLTGIRWQPGNRNFKGTGLRVPTGGILQGLLSRHQEVLGKLGGGTKYTPVPPLSGFDRAHYLAEGTRPGVPHVAFSLLRMEGTGFRSFDPVRHSARVAAMVRHTAALVAKNMGWREEDVNTRIHGHTPDGSGRGESTSSQPRLAFMPAPSIEPRGPGKLVAGNVRRVIVACLGKGGEELVIWARRALAGQEIIDEASGQPVAILAPLPEKDSQVLHYTRQAAVWITATPVVLPGYDEGKPSKQEQLVRKALLQTGVPGDLVRDAEIACRPVGFMAGMNLANRYRLPARLHTRAVHVRIVWRDILGNPVEQEGPLALGSGRFRGLGLCMAQPV